MGSTIIIKKADFSSVSIGHVNIPIDLSEDTLAWIALSGNTTMTNEQKYALDDFITTLKASTVYNKIDKMHLPLLASDKTHALVDYKNKKDDAIQALLDVYTFRNHGILSETGVANTPKIDPAYQRSTSDISLYCFATEGMSEVNVGTLDYFNSVGNKHDDSVELAAYKDTYAVQIRCNINGHANRFVDDETAAKFSPGFFGFSIKGDTIMYMKRDGSIVSTSAGDYTEAVRTGYSLLGLNKNSHVQHAATGAFIVGSALTNEEATLLRNAIVTLANTLGVLVVV